MNRSRRVRADQTPRLITARIDGTCPETGKAIKKGDTIAWYPSSRTAFHEDSPSAAQVRELQFAAAYEMPDANY